TDCGNRHEHSADRDRLRVQFGKCILKALQKAVWHIAFCILS
ncbi:MAG: hypothetical protein ACI84R_001984, partial [Candidatus Azotimanducaceae bacterium]